VEPGLYVDPGDESVEERWRGIGIRIEDDVLVTSGARQVLSATVPKAVDEVEAACRGRTLSAARS
jgi:Xaa-Pro aminopeptidase